jgi:flagellar export protein FliJ
MADLDPLIRLRKHTVEEKQKILSALYREAEQIERQKKSLQDQMEREKQIAMADGSPESSADYARYAGNVRKKIDRLNDNLKKMEGRISAAQEEVRIAFAEQKKVEIIQRNRKAEERKEIADKESDTLDEIAIEGFRRREE